MSMRIIKKVLCFCFLWFEIKAEMLREKVKTLFKNKVKIIELEFLWCIRATQKKKRLKIILFSCFPQC